MPGMVKTADALSPPSDAEGPTVRSRAKPLDLPLLPIGKFVVFPDMDFSLQINTPRSRRAVDNALASMRNLVMFSRNIEDEDGESVDDLVEIGCIVSITDIGTLPNGQLRVTFHGKSRARLREVNQHEPYFRATVSEVVERKSRGERVGLLVENVITLIDTYLNLLPGVPTEIAAAVRKTTDPGRLADLSAYAPDYTFEERQELLATTSARRRLELVEQHIQRFIEMAAIRQRVQDEVHAGVDKSQREYFLREQIKVLRKELGEGDPDTVLVEEFRDKIAKSGMPDEVKVKAQHEVERLQAQGPHSPESGMIRTYLDWMVELPWAKLTIDDLELDHAARVLDEDHYGLDKVKERILEYIAVRKLAGDRMRGPILCLVGPPGVGKTSLGRSIARALGRKCVRVSLGGVRDEAEIRGHRRTYVGSLPGRVLRGFRDAKSSNPVFILDEIDKLGADFRGDPASALLEVLDPEQNHTFSDHYLEMPFDLSKAIFVTTANTLDPIPPALLDRLEVIEVNGYTDADKVRIAQGFLMRKQLDAHGLEPGGVTLDDGALDFLIRGYTREAGVRNLEREIATLCRKVARQLAGGQVPAGTTIELTVERIEELLGSKRFVRTLAEQHDEVGVATGVAVTEAGGDVLSVEVSLMPGNGQLTLTGQLGKVMQESAQAAVSYGRSRGADWNLADKFFEEHNIHIHVPAGSVPKDGPSAGVAMATALISALTKRPTRRDVAMTGEITLRGKVLPIGGLKEKAIAAQRAGITTFLLPRDNEKDVNDIPLLVRETLRLLAVEHIDEVLNVALTLPV